MFSIGGSLGDNESEDDDNRRKRVTDGVDGIRNQRKRSAEDSASKLDDPQGHATTNPSMAAPIACRYNSDLDEFGELKLVPAFGKKTTDSVSAVTNLLASHELDHFLRRTRH